MKVSIALVLSTLLFAQSAAFEAASIKPHPEPVYVSRSSTSGARATWIAATLQDLVLEAYGLKYYQVSDGPAWKATAHFDIETKAEGETAPDKAHFEAMLQSLLADRFQLKIHRETRDMPVYALVVGKGGSKLKDADPNGHQGSVMVNATGVHMNYSHNTMGQLADHLSDTAGRPVLDRTNLPGEYALKLDFSINNGNEFENPSMPTALQDQLGLRVESEKAPVEILVIDGAEKPSEN